MSRLVKKALHPFSSRSREKLPPMEKTEKTEKTLTGEPVTLAIIGAGECGKASIYLHTYIYRSYSSHRS